MTYYADLANLDIVNGQCVNSTVPQNVTFGEQGGILDSGSNGAISLSQTQYGAAVVGALVALALGFL